MQRLTPERLAARYRFLKDCYDPLTVIAAEERPWDTSLLSSFEVPESVFLPNRDKVRVFTRDGVEVLLDTAPLFDPLNLGDLLMRAFSPPPTLYERLQKEPFALPSAYWAVRVFGNTLTLYHPPEGYTSVATWAESAIRQGREAAKGVAPLPDLPATSPW